jgi:hypothetical protein
MASSPSSASGCIDVIFKWQSRQLPVSLAPNETLLLVKERLYLLTNVLPGRQKILGLKLKTGGKFFFFFIFFSFLSFFFFPLPHIFSSSSASLVILSFSGAGVQPKDETLISELVLKQSQNLMLMGTAEAEIKAVDEMLEGESEETSGDIQLEVENALDLAKDEVNLKKIKVREV